MFLHSHEVEEQFHTLFWAEIIIPVQTLLVENWYRMLHVSVHKKLFVYHIISLENHGLFPY